ncbi:hypothetical protein EBS40_04245 [bacterium]|nr:hypothetical protein [bacterium]NDG18638.1 hypothetical protein [Betaproteobacteria bacterium]
MADKPLSIDDISRPAGATETGTPAEDISGFSRDASVQPGIGDVASEYARGLVEGLVGQSPAALGAYGGARTGFAASSRIPFGQPYTTVAGTLLGAGAGLIGGGQIGEETTKRLFDEQTDPNLKPFREAGKTTGGGLAFLPLGYTINPSTGVRVLDFLNKVGGFAKQHPILYGALETQASFGSGVGAGAAETLAPGETIPRVTGEVVGGLLNPTKLVTMATMPVADLVRRGVSRFSAGERENRAANRLMAIMQEQYKPDLRQSDPERWADEFNNNYLPNLIRALRDPGIVPEMTAAQKTGDLSLTILETSLARQNDVFGPKVAEQGRKAQEAIVEMINLLNRSGDPTALQDAARLRADYFRELLDSRLANADARSAVAIAGITKDSPANRMQIGRIIRENVDGALKDAREVEHTLWTDVPKAIRAQIDETVTRMKKQGASDDQVRAAVARLTDGQAVVANNFSRQFEAIRSEMSPEYYNREFPAIVKDIYGRLSKAQNVKNLTPDQLLKFGQEANPDLYNAYQTLQRQSSTITKKDLSYAGMKRQVDDTKKELIEAGKDFVRRGAINVGDLVNARRDMLRLAMDAEARGERANYAFYSKFSEALLDDMDQVRNPAYDAARVFSKELNDSFTRTFAGDMRGVTRTGADRIIPEVLVSRAFSGNADVINARMEQIQNAVDMLPRLHNQYVADFGPNDPRARILEDAVNRSGERVVSTADAVERGTRLAAASAIDPATGKLNTARLSRWLNENEVLVNSIPGLRQDLENATRAQNALDLIQKQNSAIETKLKKQATFTKFFDENPARLVSDALNSKNPAENFRRLVQAARTGMKSAEEIARLKASGVDVSTQVNQDLVDALKSGIYDYAYMKAGGADKFDFQQYYDAFFKPTSTGRPSMGDILIDTGVMQRGELANVKKLLGEMSRVQSVMGNKQILDQVLENSDLVEDLVLRVVGARMGAGLAEGGSTLLAASAGSRMMRDMLDRMPNESVRQLLERAAQDPSFMVQLLRKGRSEQDKIRFARTLDGYLINTGLTAGEQEPEQPAPPTVAQATAERLQRKLPAAPPSRGLLGSFAQRPQPGRPQAQGQPQPQAREMLQKLFPFDTVLR